MIEKIDHIGIAVRSIEAARAHYEKALGLTLEKIEEVPSQKVRTAFFRCGEFYIELLEPTAPDSPIAKFIESRGEGLNHIAFASDSIQADLDAAKDAGERLINEVPVEGAGEMRVGFIHPKSTFGVLTELCQHK